MQLRKVMIAISISLLLVVPAGGVVSATTFSPTEIKQVQHFQAQYARLSKTNYNANNLYAQVPHLKRKFSPGSVKSAYLNSQLAYINYYRSLFGLIPITIKDTASQAAQKTAAVMAAINANPFINQHGLPSETRPKFISKSIWKLAQSTSETSNLNFNLNNQSAGEVVTDLLTDRYNLTGTDTGHRAWLLSTRLSTTGLGAAYGTNGYRYSVQKVLNVADLFKTASQPVVSYPSSGLFPIELVNNPKIAWSLYLSNKSFNGRPKITITDEDTKRTFQAKQVNNCSSSGYGNFKTIITYFPEKTPLIVGHAYRVQIKGLYQYQFKLFQENPQTDSYHVEKQNFQCLPTSKATHNNQTLLSNQNLKLWATFSHKSLNPATNDKNYFDTLKKGQWQRSSFIRELNNQDN